MAPEDRPEVFLVGPRYGHHASHSGYERFGDRCATFLRPPVRHRFLSGRLGSSALLGDHGWRVDQLTTKVVPRPIYSLGILATEVHAATHMVRRRGAVYHAIYGETDVWLLPQVSRRSGNRLLATFHEPAESMRWLEVERVAASLDAVVLVSESQRAYFQGIVPDDRVFVVPHGVDTSFFEGPTSARPATIVLTVGSHLRDFDTFVAAMDKVLAERPDATFVGVGTRQPGGGNHQLWDERVVSLSGISDEELRHLYRSARVTVFSLYEATANNALLEAMASGAPVVATDIGGAPEALGDTGLLVPPYDADALAAAILDVLRDDDLAQELSAAARRRVQTLDFGVIADRMLEVYRTVARMPRRAG